MPKATAVFDADDSRLSGALARINGKMLALQSRIAKLAAAFIAIRAVAGVMTAGFDCRLHGLADCLARVLADLRQRLLHMIANSHRQPTQKLLRLG